MEELVAVTVIEVSVGVGNVTVKRKVFEVTPLSLAVMFVVPAATPVASPVFAPMVAIAVLEELQVTWVVMLAVELSL
jgi:hypothetical protein